MAHNAVTLGWNRRIAGDDTTLRGKPASYTISVSDSLRNALRLGSTSSLVFSLAPAEAVPGPRQPPKDTTQKDSAATKRPARRPPPKKPAADTTPMDLSVEVVDDGGRVARVALSHYGAVRRPLESYVYRRAGRDKLRFANVYEIVMQTYVVPLADFARANPSLNIDRIASVRWTFDRTDAGTVYLDNVGFSAMRAEFFAAGEER